MGLCDVGYMTTTGNANNCLSTKRRVFYLPPAPVFNNKPGYTKNFFCPSQIKVELLPLSIIHRLCVKFTSKMLSVAILGFLVVFVRADHCPADVNPATSSSLRDRLVLVERDHREHCMVRKSQFLIYSP